MFSRGSRGSGRHARADRGRHEPSPPQRSLAEELGAGEPVPPERPAGTPPPPAAGPYDLSEAPAGVRWMDLGSLRIPSVPGVEVRVQARAEGQIQQVYLVDGASVLQLGAYAAPRTEPIWDEVRAEIRRSLFDDGVAAEEVPGPYGTELRARLRTPDGLKDLRFVGVDGPRWLVRAVYQGPAAVDPAQAGRLAECLAQVVVARDEEARPAKEPLPLRLPAALADQAKIASAQAPAGPDRAPAGSGQVYVSSGQVSRDPTVPSGTSSSGTSSSGTSSSGSPRRRPSPRPRRQAGAGPERGYG